jgi:cyclic pyranopterin phosphate synthase
MAAATARLIEDRSLSKGDVLGVARIAGILAAKRTGELLPLVEEALLGAVEIDFELTDSRLLVTARVQPRDGVDGTMAALTACAVAALTIYDMCKAVDRSMAIGELTSKTPPGSIEEN